MGSTSIVNLNIGNNTALEVLKSQLRPHNLAVTGATFNIKDIAENIDVNKISNIRGATLDKTTGVMSGYRSEEAITYTYDCGISKNGNELIEFTIMPKKESPELTINKALDKIYDGKPVVVVDKDVVTNSTGAISYTWDKKQAEYDFDVWDQIEGYPIDAGEYRVTINVAETDTLSSAEIVQRFEISKAETTIALREDQKIYDGQPVELSDADFDIMGTGAFSFKWINADGTESSEAPVNAGTYQLKVSVAEDMNHNAAKKKQFSFTIDKAETTIKLNKDLNKPYDGTPVSLSDSDLGITGSTGMISYQWEMEQDGEWVACDVVMKPGKYRVQIGVAGDKNHKDGSLVYDFTISAVADGNGGTPT